MKVRYMIIVSLILAILMVGAVSATDQLSEDIISDEDDATLQIEENDIYKSGENSFSNLSNEIEGAGASLGLDQDYAFNNVTDNKNGIVIAKDNFII